MKELDLNLDARKDEMMAELRRKVAQLEEKFDKRLKEMKERIVCLEHGSHSFGEWRLSKSEKIRTCQCCGYPEIESLSWLDKLKNKA